MERRSCNRWCSAVPPNVPRATYRVQLHRNFTLDDAAGLVDYLAELGISHLYCSPYLQARPGSKHGYDIVDHRKISDELGGSQAHARLIEQLKQHEMGHILDLVPNHMTITERSNALWWDVLKNGPYSEYAGFFDIDWDPPEARLRRNILIPILGDHYGRVLEKREIQLEHDGGEVVIRYYEHVLPVAPGSIEYAIGEGATTEEAIRRVNEDIDALHSLLELQHYRLAFWKTAGKELNYRRFFAINDLAALRMDNGVVFDHVHELVLDLVEQGRLEGLRIDHIDGLRYPTRYLRELRDRAPRAYIVVEKILEPTEELRRDWPIQGTTGYDFLNRVGALFVDADGLGSLTEFYEEFTGEIVDLEEQRRAKKMQMIETEFGGEVERLTDLFVTVCETHRQYRDYTRAELREALRETVAAFPVYRTYVDPKIGLTTDDTRYVQEALASARAQRPDLDGELFELLGQILLLNIEGPEAEALALRFQQTTGPVVAKGIEDTLFYTFNRLISLNDVGGDPGRFALSLEEFHQQSRRAQENWPLAMLASSTHDTKRAEDVRSRIGLLAEIPEQWAETVGRWARMNDKHKRNDLPDRNAEYLLYQTLVGAWPLGVRRATVFMQKVVREAKVHTSWIDREPTYEAAVHGFTERVVGDRDFQDDLERFMRSLVVPGYVTSLAQTLIKLTSPGVPDFYQGCEVWNLALVDPDNRRWVDYGSRRDLLRRVKTMDARQAWAERDSGAPKMFITHRSLGLRRERPDAFGPQADYVPLLASGSRADHLVAYRRGDDVIAIAPRLVLRLDNEWADTRLALPAGRWHDRLSDSTWSGIAAVADLLQDFPVALLVRQPSN